MSGTWRHSAVARGLQLVQLIETDCLHHILEHFQSPQDPSEFFGRHSVVLRIAGLHIGRTQRLKAPLLEFRRSHFRPSPFSTLSSEPNILTGMQAKSHRPGAALLG